MFEQTTSDELASLIHAAGSLAHASVTKKTTHLVMGYKSKSAKKMTDQTSYLNAVKQGVKIMTENEFLEFCRIEFNNKYFTFENWR